MEGPRILAGFVQGSLTALSERDPERAERVASRLTAATRDRLSRTSRIAWLPIEIDVELTDAIYAELGASRAREFFHHNLAGFLDGPVLRSLTQGALRLFGASPVRFFGWAPKAYAQLYREAGEMRFGSEEPGTAWLTIERLPPCTVAGPSYVDGMAASIAAGFDVLGIKGEVCVESRVPEAGSVRFRLAWEEEGAGGETLPAPVGA